MRTMTTDVVIIGAGPIGLYQAYELGLHGLQSVLIDSLLDIGGQFSELHPDEPIYGIPSVLETNTKTLVDSLWQQALVFDPRFILGERVVQIHKHHDNAFEITTNKHTVVQTKSVIIAGGKGVFEPVKLVFPGIEKFENKQVFYQIVDLSKFKNKGVIVVGDTDSAFQWALTLQKITNHVVLIHHSTDFRASPDLVEKMMDLHDQAKMQFICADIDDICHNHEQLTDIITLTEQGYKQKISLDALVVFMGVSPQVNTFHQWGLEMNNSQIQVNNITCQSSKEGIYAVGDVCYYSGRRDRLLSGFHEAGSAAQSVANSLFSSKKIMPLHTTYNQIEIQHLQRPFPLTNIME